MTPAEAVRGFLDALGVPAGADPGRPRRRRPRCTAACWPAGGCWWCWTTPATPSRSARCCPARPAAWSLVTSRNQLTGLVAAEGAHPLAAGPARPPPRPASCWPAGSARDRVAGRAGGGRRDHRPVRPAAAGAGHRRRPGRHPPGLPLAALAARAARRRRAGSTRSTAATPAPTCGRCSPGPTARCDPAAARLFRLLGLHPGPDIVRRRPRPASPASPVPQARPAAGRAGPGAPAHRARPRPVRASTTCCAPTPPNWPHASTPSRRAARRCAGCSTTTCTPPRRRPAAAPAPRRRSTCRRRAPAPALPASRRRPRRRRWPGSPPSTRCCSPPSAWPPSTASTPTPGSWPGRCQHLPRPARALARPVPPPSRSRCGAAAHGGRPARAGPTPTAASAIA